MNPKQALRRQILTLVAEYHQVAHEKPAFVPGETRIPYSGRVYDEREMTLLTDSALDFWLTAGPYADRFERRMRQFLGCRDFLLVNSGSSANLLMLSTLCAPGLANHLQPGDEVVTPAVTFPTTVAPIVQNRLVPVFVDCEVGTYNINPRLVEDAIGPRTRAIFVPHTLGNPFDVEAILDFCKENNLWLIEDNCDALGSRYKLDGEWRNTGSFGHVATLSFYPAHHMTTGEGGAVCTSDPALKRVIESLRDWGRDCWCPSGHDDTCKHRFTGKFGELPRGYDHKYVYSRFGYNLKMTDLQAAIGCAQIEKLDSFIDARKQNWKTLSQALAPLEKYLILPEPAPNADPSWFGFVLSVRPGAPVSRNEMVRHLESNGIQTRMLFAGNILRHPCCAGRKGNWRVAGELQNSDFIVENTFWLGVYPGMNKQKLEYIVDCITRCFKK